MTLLAAIVTATNECKDPYAQSYLRAIEKARDLFGEEGGKTQILYALNNMQGWRGETAREVKKVLKSYANSPCKTSEETKVENE